jgi:hypothetical protein
MTVRLFTTLALSSYLGQRKTQQHSAQRSANAVWNSCAALSSVAALSIMMNMNSAAVHGATWRWEATAAVSGCMCRTTTRHKEQLPGVLAERSDDTTRQAAAQQNWELVHEQRMIIIWEARESPTLDTPVCRGSQNLGTDAINFIWCDTINRPSDVQQAPQHSVCTEAGIAAAWAATPAAVPSRIVCLCTPHAGKSCSLH